MYGSFVRRVRESRDLSQKDLAEISGISQPNISAIENGRRSPSTDTLNRLLVACGYELAAVAGERVIHCPLPHTGWFPDDDLPPRLPDDPPDEEPSITPSAPMAARVRIITAVLDAATPGPPRPSMSLVELVLEVHRHLDRAGTSHAFGGALALAYVTEPRGTIDIDVNIFSPMTEIDAVLQVFAAIDLRPERSRADWVPPAGIRLRRDADPFPVDVFPALSERYAEIERRCERHPFGPGGDRLPFLSPEDLTVFKLSFGRDKDWVDIRAMAAAEPDLDVAYIEDQLMGLRGPLMYPRIARLRRLVRPEHQ